MDPDETLRRIRQLLLDLERAEATEDRSAAHRYAAGLSGRVSIGVELAELVEGMDMWLSRGGALPRAWRKA